MPGIVYFEIPANDIHRAKNFYRDIFGWEIEQIPGMGCWRISGKEGFDGCMLKRMHPDQKITNYIGVPSVEDYLSKVKMLGGKVILPKKAVPGRGYFAICQDTEGNAFILWEKDGKAE